MFNANNLQTLLKGRPFAPFRFVMSDGGTVEVRSPEFIMLGRQFAVVGLPDPAAAETFIDRWTTIWYMHVTRVEQLHPGAPPFTTPAGPADSSTPSTV
jgi:hypothetical protein